MPESIPDVSVVGARSEAQPRRKSVFEAARHKACDACKRRKIRCSGSNPCQNCQRNHITCAYTSTHGRLTVLERQLTEAKKQVRLLRAAWHKHVPNINLEHALKAVETPNPPINQSMPDDPICVTVQPHSYQSGDATTPRDTTEAWSGHIEGEDDKSDNLEWNETANFLTLADGIGSLTVNPKGSGYMGPQSGNALLRYLQSISNFFPDAPTSQDDGGADIGCERSSMVREPPLSSAFTQCCIDWYFKYYHPAYPILHEGYFRAQKMGVVPKSHDGSWPLLLNIVLAIGAFAGPQSSQAYDMYFFKRAREHINIDLLQRGSLQLVQSFALLANYAQKRNMPNSGFTLLGIAFNLALGIGLHREFSLKSSSAFTMEIRRRVWWTLFIFDSGARLTFGRPTMALLGTNIKMLANLHDSDISVDIGQLPPSQNEPTAASSLIWQSKLAEISNAANTMLLERRLPDKVMVFSLCDRVQAWSQALPSYFHQDDLHPDFVWFEVPRAILIWRSWHLRIVMTRPFLLDVVRNRRVLDKADDAVGMCTSSAQECVLSITKFCRGRDELPGSLTWYATYWLVTAVFVNVTCLLYDPYNELSQSWRQQVEESKLVLESMGSAEPLAKRAAFILEKITDLVPTSPDSAIFRFNEPMRMEIADVWGQSWNIPPVFDQQFEEIIQMPDQSNQLMDNVSQAFH